MTEQSFQNVQIAFQSNNKTLIAANNSLVLATEQDKSLFALHGKYSRIKLTMTDFEKNPSVSVNFYLKPEEIRRIYNRVQRCQGKQAWEFISFKQHKTKKVEGGRIGASQIRIERTPFETDFNTKQPKTDPNGNPISIRLPWLITISQGSCLSTGKDAKMDKTVRKRLDDNSFEDFLCMVVAHISVWENVVGGKLLLKLLQQGALSQELALHEGRRMPDAEAESYIPEAL